MVLFLDPHSRKDVKAMRQKYDPDSNKSSRRLYSQALKMRKHCSHLFAGGDACSKTKIHLKYILLNELRQFFCIYSFLVNALTCHACGFTLLFVLLIPPARVDLQPSSNVWYQILKDKIHHQQSKPVWVSEVTVWYFATTVIHLLHYWHELYLYKTKIIWFYHHVVFIIKLIKCIIKGPVFRM